MIVRAVIVVALALGVTGLLIACSVLSPLSVVRDFGTSSALI